MSLVTVSEVRALVDTDLTDDDLREVIDRAEAEMVAHVGSHASSGAVTETVINPGGVLYLSRPAASITSVTEYWGLSSTVTGSVITTTSYYPNLTGSYLHRLGSDWADRVVVVYVPADDDERRRSVLIELIRLELSPSGMASESMRFADGTSYAYQSGEGGRERARAGLFQRLRGIRL